MATANDMTCPSGKECIILGLNEKIDTSNLDPVVAFYSNVPMNFLLKSDNGVDLPLKFYGITALNQGQNLGFAFTIDQNILSAGVKYKVQYNSATTQGKFSWFFADDLSFTK
jgi:hypothetical protein